MVDHDQLISDLRPATFTPGAAFKMEDGRVDSRNLDGARGSVLGLRLSVLP